MPVSHAASTPYSPYNKIIFTSCTFGKDLITCIIRIFFPIENEFIIDRPNYLAYVKPADIGDKECMQRIVCSKDSISACIEIGYTKKIISGSSIYNAYSELLLKDKRIVTGDQGIYTICTA